MKRDTIMISALSAVFAAAVSVFAFGLRASGKSASGASDDVRDEPEAEAQLLDIDISVPEDVDAALLTDGVEKTYADIPEGGTVTIEADGGISSLYVLFDTIPGTWTLFGGGNDARCGADMFLHEYIDAESLLGSTQKSLTMSFPKGCGISEVYAFGEGNVPSWVQIWEPPCDEADLMLASTHIDDEQLFFAGILPYYAGELGLDVQVVYFTTPFTFHDRQHEQLNGLWTVGVRHYPVCGEFQDAYSETAKDAYADQKDFGFEREDIVDFQVEMIRRFRPHVIVGHDINGEYGHGQHIINSETLMEAVPLAADASYDPGSAEKYGIWDTPKTYIHLWSENKIVMDWDVPLEKFGGKTAFQVTQDGFMCHKSQHWTWFYKWIYGKETKITKASEIEEYSPCEYGLFRSTVGTDVKGGDMFENIPQSYAEIRAEEARLEEESRAAWESESESVRVESERAESERLAGLTDTEKVSGNGKDDNENESEKGKNGEIVTLIVTSAAAAAAAAFVVIAPKFMRKKQEKDKRS